MNLSDAAMKIHQVRRKDALIHLFQGCTFLTGDTRSIFSIFDRSTGSELGQNIDFPAIKFDEKKPLRLRNPVPFRQFSLMNLAPYQRLSENPRLVQKITADAYPIICTTLNLKFLCLLCAAARKNFSSAPSTEISNVDHFCSIQAPRLVTDVSFDCPIKFYLNSVEKKNGKKTRIYRYALDGPRAKTFSESMGAGPATHTDDVMFFLGIALNKASLKPQTHWNSRFPFRRHRQLEKLKSGGVN